MKKLFKFIFPKKIIELHNPRLENAKYTIEVPFFGNLKLISVAHELDDLMEPEIVIEYPLNMSVNDLLGIKDGDSSGSGHVHIFRKGDILKFEFRPWFSVTCSRSYLELNASHS